MHGSPEGFAASAGSKRARYLALALVFAGFTGLVTIAGVAWARERRVGASPALLSGIAFRDQHGTPFELEQLGGSTVLLNFVFTRCAAVCPTQTRELAALRQALPDDLRDEVKFVSVSLDPSHDTPAELERFAEKNGARFRNWSFLAASPEATRRLVGQLQGAAPSVLAEAAASRQVSMAPESRHETALYLFDREGRLLQRYVGAPIDQPRLVSELAGADRVGRSLASARSFFR
jgi:protein SCO1/2